MPYSVVCQPAAMFWACTAGVWCALWRRDRASWLPSTAGPTPTLTSPDCGTALALRGDPPALSTLMCDAGPFGEPTGAQPRRAVLLCGSVSRFRVMALRVEWHSSTLPSGLCATAALHSDHPAVNWCCFALKHCLPTTPGQAAPPFFTFNAVQRPPCGQTALLLPFSTVSRPPCGQTVNHRRSLRQAGEGNRVWRVLLGPLTECTCT